MIYIYIPELVMSVDNEASNIKNENLSAKELKEVTVDFPQQLVFALEQFLIDLESIKEMFEVVTLRLKQDDKKRLGEIERSSKDIQNKVVSGDHALQEIIKIADTFRKIARADLIFRQNSLVMLVSKYDEFLSEILTTIFRNNPDRLKSPDKTLSYDEILQVKTIEEALSKFIAKEVDKIIRESHSEHIKYLDKQLKINLQQKIVSWKKFVELTERRNLFVHTGGRISRQYTCVCIANEIKLDNKVQENTILNVTDQYFEEAYECLFEIGFKIGQSVYRKLFSDRLEPIETSLNSVGVRLLEKGQWGLSKIIFDYGLSIPSKMLFSEEFHRLYMINKCIALKGSGDVDSMLKLLNSVDWSASHQRFILAGHVLKNEYDEAEKIMVDMPVRYISEEYYRTWPLFQDFRNSEQFKRAFKILFRKDFIVEVPEDTVELLRQEKEQRNSTPEIINEDKSALLDN